MEENKRISELPDAEFLSFLYAERDRENSLCQYQGWNNWALAGAIITVSGVMYAILKDSAQLDWIRVVYSATGIIAFFLAYHSLLGVFKRERGHDFTKVRLLKEMTPWTDVGLCMITAITAVVLILIKDRSSLLMWLWIIAFALQSVPAFIAWINRNRIVPFYSYRAFFPQLWWNIIYNGIVCSFLALIWRQSFESASWRIPSPEFELGICIGAVVILFYLIIQIKVENKVAEKFDAIVDMYVYAGASKEETYQSILCNRMGYGVMDVCKADLQRVQNMSKACEKKIEELKELKTKINNGNHNASQTAVDRKRLKDLLHFFEESINQSDRLARRLDEKVKVAPVLDDTVAMKTIFETNHKLNERVVTALKEVRVVIDLLQSEQDKYHCTRVDARCMKLDCEHRKDPKDKNYIRQQRQYHSIKKIQKRG